MVGEDILNIIGAYCFIWAGILIIALITMLANVVYRVHRDLCQCNDKADVYVVENILLFIIAVLMVISSKVF